MPKGGWRAAAGRPTHRLKTQHFRNIDIRRFSRDGLLASPWQGVWSWRDAQTGSVNAAISLRISSKSIGLRYTCDGHPVNAQIALERTACTYGGTRAWFNCPTCSRRCAVLYMRMSRFQCRLCHDLRYQCQSEDALGRGQIALEKIEAKLDSYWQKPKGMHLSTRERLVSRIIEIEMMRDDIMNFVTLQHSSRT
jgi:hypothetical protein